MLGCVSESHAELCRVFVDSLPKENDGSVRLHRGHQVRCLRFCLVSG